MFGGEWGPVTLVAFKAIDPVLRGQDGGFDSHTLPPTPLDLGVYRERGTNSRFWHQIKFKARDLTENLQPAAVHRL